MMKFKNIYTTYNKHYLDFQGGLPSRLLPTKQQSAMPMRSASRVGIDRNQQTFRKQTGHGRNPKLLNPTRGQFHPTRGQSRNRNRDRNHNQKHLSSSSSPIRRRPVTKSMFGSTIPRTKQTHHQS